MGNKINARQLMQKAKVPVIPGSDGVIDSVEEALTIAEEIGYPVMLKAVPLVVAEKESEKFFQKKSYRNTLLQREEAKAAFGNDDMYLEKLFIQHVISKCKF